LQEADDRRTSADSTKPVASVAVVRFRAATIAFTLLVAACGDGSADEPAATSTAAPVVTSAPTTTTAPTITTSANPAPPTTAEPLVEPPPGEYKLWNGLEYGFAVSVPDEWAILGEVSEATRAQIIGVMGVQVTNERIATRMVVAANPTSNGEGLFVAAVPPTAGLGDYDEFDELSNLDDEGLRRVEAMFDTGGEAREITARLTQTSQGHIALVVSLRQFGLFFEMITITPADGAAWTLVGFFDEDLHASGAGEVILDSFVVTSEPLFPEPRPANDELIEAVAGRPTIEGDSLPAFVHGAATDEGIGLTAPTVVGTDSFGTPVAIEHDGTPKAIMLLAHWCSHCQNEVPAVQAWLDATGGVPGVEIIAVITSYVPDRGNWPPQDWLEREKWTPNVIYDDAVSSIYRAYGTGPFPYWVFLNGDGTVALRAAGEMGVETLELILDGLAG
jgi:thiol-disulfide isomerase/thioredoxin